MGLAPLERHPTGADVPFFERNGGTGPVVRGLDEACTETETTD
jgi:hypothetical protein